MSREKAILNSSSMYSFLLPTKVDLYGFLESYLIDDSRSIEYEFTEYTANAKYRRKKCDNRSCDCLRSISRERKGIDLS